MNLHTLAFLLVPQSEPAVAPADDGSGFAGAAVSLEQQLAASLEELSALRAEIAAEKIPLAHALREHEDELSRLRTRNAEVSRLLDGATVDLTRLRGDLKSLQDEVSYRAGLFGEFTSGFETRLHIAELDRWRPVVEGARLAAQNSSLTREQIDAAQLALLTASVDRLEDALGGARFAGSAADEGGVIHRGTFLQVGPTVLFRAQDGSRVGTAEQRLGSLSPAVFAFDSPLDQAAAEQVMTRGDGVIPFDATMGNAQKVEATEETLKEHIILGGPVMVPIFILGGAALLVVLVKWLQMAFLRTARPKRMRALLDALAAGDRAAAQREAAAVGGPTGQMLAIATHHLDEPKELIEELMYEKVLQTKLKLQRMLPFVAVSASAAPLFGLLGTVTGIMTTFKLITVFGTGDVKTLSSGISEALITTEYGLIVAIPSLLLHALLSRKAKGLIDAMEKAALAFMNQLAMAPAKRAEAA
jgi:biopolymer transport protein ExbB